jgi:uncharacterized membrane protein YraQ (UPF0718 family)
VVVAAVLVTVVIVAIVVVVFEFGAVVVAAIMVTVAVGVSIRVVVGVVVRVRVKNQDQDGIKTKNMKSQFIIDHTIPTKRQQRIDSEHNKFIKDSIKQLKEKGYEVIGANVGWARTDEGYCTKIYTNRGAVFADSTIHKNNKITHTLVEP